METGGPDADQLTRSPGMVWLRNDGYEVVAVIRGQGISAGVAMAVLVMAAGCAEISTARYRDDAYLQQYRYALGEQYIEINGLRICYQEQGGGEHVLIIPGLCTSIDFWQLNIPSLAERYHVLAVDPPGVGKSDKPNVPYDLLWIRDQILAFMDAKGVERAHLIGGSMGGHLAMLMARDHPERVGKLVMMGSSGTWPKPGPLLVIGLYTIWQDFLVVDHLRRNWPDIHSRLFIRETPLTRELFRYHMALRANLKAYWPEGRVARRALRSIFFHSLRGQLGDIRNPSLIVWGKGDTLHLHDEALCLRQGLPDSRLVVISDSAHEVIVDQAGQFNDLVLRFLRDGTAVINDDFNGIQATEQIRTASGLATPIEAGGGSRGTSTGPSRSGEASQGARTLRTSPPASRWPRS